MYIRGIRVYSYSTAAYGNVHDKRHSERSVQFGHEKTIDELSRPVQLPTAHRCK